MLKSALMSNKKSIETGNFSGLMRTEDCLEWLTKEMCEEMKTLDDSLKIVYYEWKQRNVEK